MILELSVLGGAAALLLLAIHLRREPLLLVAVLAYAATTSWLLQRDLGFLLPALGLAIVLGLFGIALTLRGEVSSPKVTMRYSSFKFSTNKTAEAESIGP